jgi:D-amino-acid dehydrogenase
MRKVIVIGGGVVGVAIAYELARRGHSTTLFEAREEVALETSFANGGLLTPSMADPWNAPGVHRQLAASLFNTHSALKLHASALPSLLGWGWRFLRHSTVARHTAATLASYRLARYSTEHTRALRERLSLNYAAASCGSLKVFATLEALTTPLALARRLEPLGMRFEVLDAAGAVALEPALAESRARIAAAIRFPDDETGDARLFSAQLAGAFVAAGGTLRSDAHVSCITVERGAVSGVRIGDLCEVTPTVIVAAGNSSAALVRPHGLSLPIRPAKGYTLTFDASEETGAPRVPVIDDASHTAIVPLGMQIRLAGTAEFAGNDLRLDPRRIASLFSLLETLMPSIARRLPRATARPWTGLRPMSADGLPFIGTTPIRGLYVNAGHGHLGWTFAAGSARLLADLVEGKDPEIDPSPYRALR